MKYDIKSLIDNLKNDKNDDYKIYYEDEKGDHISPDYLTGKEVLEQFNKKKKDSHCKYAEIQYDPQEDEELEDRIVLIKTNKREVDLFGIKLYI